MEILSIEHRSPPLSEKDLCPHTFEILACVPKMESPYLAGRPWRSCLGDLGDALSYHFAPAP